MPEFAELLSPQEVTALARSGHHRQWDRGAVIFREADRSDWVLVLESGRVKVTGASAAGTEVVLAVRGPGALLGELTAIDGQPRSATVTALETVTGLVIPVPAFQTYLQAHGRVALLLMGQLAEKLRDADRKRIEFGAYDTTGRVAARLVELASRFGEATPEGLRIAMPLSQDELAGWTGSSREAVSKALGVLRTSGCIRTGRLQVIVLDLPALRRRAHDG
ncbi:MAG TPA: Crp/Fnr family transcriptional regulator [Micromonosporaceae bacterium]|nr:Crp/Fnr family transcriptional regulator [Micromonosporaceae bacterium]